MPKTILIAEDYADSRCMMKVPVESYGHLTVEAENGEEAVETVKGRHFDLILMDMSMPVTDGLAATRLIRKYNGITELPIIAVTADGRLYYDKAIEAGCNDLIDKPFDFGALKTILNKYLNR